MPGRVGVSSDQAVHEKGERVDGSSSPPRSGGDADSPRVDAAIGVANPQRGLLHAMVSPPVAPSGLPAISPTSTVGEKPKQRCGSEKPWIQARGEDTERGLVSVSPPFGLGGVPAQPGRGAWSLWSAGLVAPSAELLSRLRVSPAEPGVTKTQLAAAEATKNQIRNWVFAIARCPSW
jgi:hypothetical protein